MYFSLPANLKRPWIASTLRLVRNPKHNFPARVMSRGLLLRRDRFTQR
jgi:hypothetical protein